MNNSLLTNTGMSTHTAIGLNNTNNLMQQQPQQQQQQSSQFYQTTQQQQLLQQQQQLQQQAFQPSYKHLIPAESILKPFLPKVNTASTRVPPSTKTLANNQTSIVGGLAATTTPLSKNQTPMTYSTGNAYDGGIKQESTGKLYELSMRLSFP